VGVRVGVATHADCEATIALWHTAGLTRPWNDPASDFTQALANPTSAILLAHDKTDLVGSVMVGFDGHRGWVYYLASDPGRRFGGIGRALMLAAEDWLKARSCAKIQLMVRTDNSAALGFYAAIGYMEQDVVTIGRRFDSDA
jgi:ribosomal protein S18 acetylase RimI-like enzyme